MKSFLLSALLLALARGASAQGVEPEAEVSSTETALSLTPAPPRSAPLRGRFTDTSLQEILNALGGQAGVKVLYDADFRDKKVSISVEDETFDAVLRQITLTNGLFYKALDEKTIVIAPDSPAKRRRYDGWVEPRPLPQVRNRAPISLDLPEASLMKVFEALGQQAGVKILFDKDFRDRRVSVRFNAESFEAALSQLTLVYVLFYKALDANSLVIAPDSPATRRRYEVVIEGQPPAAAAALGCGDASWAPSDEEFGASIRFGDDLWVGFSTRLGNMRAPVHNLTQSVVHPPGRYEIDRVVSDRERKHYVGYRLEVRWSGEGRPFRVEVKSLPEASWERLCRSCPAGALHSKIARYPEPFALGSGGSFALDLMANAATGEKIVDQVKILQSERRGQEARARRFKVELAMAREGDGYAAGVCVRDLESGDVVGGIPRFRVTSRSDDLILTQTGRSQAGKPMTINVRMALENEGRTALYSVEIWEAGEVVHSEETRFPVGVS